MIITENGITTEYGVSLPISESMTLNIVRQMRGIETYEDAWNYVQDLRALLEREHLYAIWSETTEEVLAYREALRNTIMAGGE